MMHESRIRAQSHRVKNDGGDVGLLKAAYDDEPSRKPLPASNDDGEYEVEKIVSHKKRKDGKKVYLVKCTAKFSFRHSDLTHPEIFSSR